MAVASVLLVERIDIPSNFTRLESIGSVKDISRVPRSRSSKENWTTSGGITSSTTTDAWRAFMTSIRGNTPLSNTSIIIPEVCVKYVSLIELASKVFAFKLVKSPNITSNRMIESICVVIRLPGLIAERVTLLAPYGAF